jgi:cyclopropane fatty-acyl-phospholipid synthase-like methyltransferase
MPREWGEKHPNGRWHSPAADRNKGPILDVLRRVLPPTGNVLEIGSGSGQHVIHFAEALPDLTWQPTDADAELRASVTMHLRASPLKNVNPPVELDVMRLPWPVRSADAIVSINMIHIAPRAATRALLEGAGQTLKAGGALVLYGPYRRHGRHTALSNEAFDAALRTRNPEWGLRDLEDVTRLAEGSGLALEEVVEMPANNLTLVFQKRGAAAARES